MNGIMNMIKFGKVGIAMLFLYFLGYLWGCYFLFKPQLIQD